jgi:hypothetical protein
MNKKIIIFIVLILSALSILAISVWGTLPEANDRPSVVSLAILDYTLLNYNGDKILSVKDVITEENYIFEIKFVINPTESDSQIRARTDQEGITARVDDYESTVYVIFDIDKIGTTVTITIWDKNTQIKDQIILMFLPPSEINVDDPDIF